MQLSPTDVYFKILIQCPHPTVRESYINYLRPLMSPCADLSRPKEQLSSTTPPPLPDRNKQYRDLDELNPNEDEDDETNACEIYVYADDEHPEEEEHQNDGVFHKQWKYDEEPYDDIFLESAEEDEEDFS